MSQELWASGTRALLEAVGAEGKATLYLQEASQRSGGWDV